MKIIRSISVFILSLLSLIAFAQFTHAQSPESYTFNLPADQSTWYSETLTMGEPIGFIGVVAEGFEGNEEGLEVHEHFELEVKIKVNGREIWYAPEFHVEHGQGAEAMLSTEPTQALQLRYRGGALENPVQITTHFLPVDQTEDRVDELIHPKAENGLEIGGGPEPLIISRNAWGADENLRFVDRGTSDGSTSNPCKDLVENYPQDFEISYNPDYDDPADEPYWAPKYSSHVAHLVVHHTSTGPVDGDYAAKVRDIYRYHTVSRGWGDIGYNYLIDPNGVIYEGRYGGEHNELPVVGGHALCSNANTLGIAMIGNHQENPMSPEAVEALTDLLAYFSHKHDLDPMGQSLWHGEVQNVIGGHRDFQSTACPGQYLYDLLPHIREVTESKLQSYGEDFDPTTLPYYAEVVEKEQSITLDPYETDYVTVNYINRGTLTWGPQTWLYNVLDSSNFTVPLVNDQPYVLANMDQSQVKPGETATFQVQLKAGLEAKEGLIYAVPAVDNKAKLSLASATINVNVNEPRFTYEVLEQDLPSGNFKSGMVMKNEANQFYSVVLKNTSNITWPKGEMILAASGPKGRKSLFTNGVAMAHLVENQVKPGETGTFEFTSLKAPLNSPGENIEQFTPALKTSDGTLYWFTDKAMGFRVNIDGGNRSLMSANLLDALPHEQETSDLLRVKLSYEPSFDDSLKVSSDQPFYLQNLKGGRYLELPAGTTVSFKRWRGNILSFRTSTNQKGLVSGLRITAKPDVPLRIDSWDNPPAWNDQLNDNEFLGTLEFRVDTDEKNLLTINELPMEDYLKGIAEVSNGDPEEKLKVIAVLAGTYARFYQEPENRKFPGKPYDASDDPDVFQKYKGFGYQKRSPNFSRAVEEVGDMVVTYNGQLVKTPYFTQTGENDRMTRSAQEVWGWTDYPFLQSVADPCQASGSAAGHQVGMSGCGATVMAEQGKSYLDIIEYFYPGTQVKEL